MLYGSASKIYAQSHCAFGSKSEKRRRTFRSCHCAEIVAIRSATRKLHSFNLQGCTIYTSCEPCPMCLAAIYWAHLDKIYYANSKTDAKNIGFDDSFIYDEIALKPELRKIETTRLLADEAITAFKRWTDMDEKIEY